MVGLQDVRETSEQLEIIFGSRSGEFLAIRPLQRPYRDAPPDADDFDWVRCLIAAKLGGFQASFEAHLLASEFPPFRDALQTLWNDLRGEATFTTMEGQVTVRVRGDGRGHMSVSGELEDIAGIGNRLVFELELDQTCLVSTLSQFDDVIERYPPTRRFRRT
jgi:hypothetical protein